MDCARIGSIGLIALLGSLGPAWSAHAEVPAEPAPAKTRLRVGTRIAPPFSMKKGERWSGITHALLGRVADQEGLDIEYVELGIEDLIQKLESGEIDVAAAALTITEAREHRVDFSHPIHQAGLGLAVRPTGDLGAWSIFERLASPAFAEAAGALLLMLALTGTLMWVVERKRNPSQFPRSPHQGIGAGLWWSAVTMTTVGYGDKAPVSPLGRAIGLVWMFASIIVISSFTAAIATSLTVGELDHRVRGLQDLDRRAVATVSGSVAAQWLDDEGFRFAEVDALADALDQLERGRVDAVLYDLPLLRFERKRRGEDSFQILPQVLAEQAYGLAFPTGSPYREQFNRRILGLLETKAWTAVLTEHLGER